MSLVLVALTLVGCDALRDAFSPRAETVARANDQTLTVARLGEWAGTGKQVPLDAMALSRLSHVWVDYALLAQALAAGQDLRDSATVLAAQWPLVSQMKWERFHEKIASSGELTPQQVDSAFDAGQLRMFQHILFQIPPNATASSDGQKRRQAEQVLVEARSAGRRFGQLASRYSDDNGSKVDGGSLGVSPRGQYVPAFEDAAWELRPGAVSNIVKSPFGYHIIRRPPLAEVRDAFRAGLEERMTLRGDSLYLDSLTQKRRIEPDGRAPTLVRAAVQDLDAARANSATLVKYRGGRFRVRDLVRWLGALDPQIIPSLSRAPDDQINQFLKAIVQRQLLLEQADSAKVTLTPEDWQQLRAQHDTGFALLGTVLNLTPEMVRDSVTSPEGRLSFAMTRVNDYMDRVVHGRARYMPVPVFLAEVLRERGSWDVNEAGVRRALERGQQIRSAADSARAPGVPRMTPAPGGPPIDTTQRRAPR